MVTVSDVQGRPGPKGKYRAEAGPVPKNYGRAGVLNYNDRANVLNYNVQQLFLLFRSAGPGPGRAFLSAEIPGPARLGP
jgi:hypothetical protein